MKKRKRNWGNAQYEYVQKEPPEHFPKSITPNFPEEEKLDSSQNVNRQNDGLEKFPNKNSESFFPKGSKKQLRSEEIKLREERKERAEKPKKKTKNEKKEIPKKTTILQKENSGISKEGQVCPICYTNIPAYAKIWSCKQCFYPFHLNCLIQWIHKSNEEVNKKMKGVVWTCPHCCYYYNGRLPEYFCYCGKVKNPESNKFSVPHSCGDVCGKTRGKICNHPCNIECHPGACPPCNLFTSKVKCFCGKEEKPLKCSDNESSWQCGSICGKALSCGNHSCEKFCHEGECGECNVIITQKCRCGKSDKLANCGAEDFSCGKMCNKVLTCGNHHCEQICHKGECTKCQLTPQVCKFCPCGKMEISFISTVKRQSCLDLVPTCGLPCRKYLPCGEHQCKEGCHVGPCNECQVFVDKECRCGQKTFKLKCCDVQKQEIRCEKVCKKMKSCKKHSCEEICCPFKSKKDNVGAHLCLKVCNKPLNCGNHRCELFCHLGFCKPCPIFMNIELKCPCGKTVKRPPLPCGTKNPECHEICGKPLNCGHSCLYNCHAGECKPCAEITPKYCVCGKEFIDDSICGKVSRCNFICATQLACGHKCQIDCHVHNEQNESEQNLCNQKCFKEKECGHKCMETCHFPEQCPDFCSTEIKLACECGHRECFHRCDEIKKVSLPCNDECERLKRFGALLEEAKKNSNKAFYHPQVLKYAKNNFVYVTKLEEKIEKFMKSDKNFMDIDIGNDFNKKMFLQNLLSQHYKFTLQFYLNKKAPFVTLIKDNDVKFPPIPLSQYVRKVHKGEIIPNYNIFEASVKILGTGKSDILEELDKLIKGFQDEFYREIGTGNITLYFWNKEKAEEVRKVLKNSFSTFNNVHLEILTAATFENLEQELVLKSEETLLYNEIREITDSIIHQILGIEEKPKEEFFIEKNEPKKEDNKAKNIFEDLKDKENESDSEFIPQ